MLKISFAIFMLLHGFIHLMGFAKAFGYANIPQLTKFIARPAGTLWLLSALLFITAAILVVCRKELWIIVAIISVILSQYLLITVWKDAKVGTIANGIILTVAIIMLLRAESAITPIRKADELNTRLISKHVQ